MSFLLQAESTHYSHLTFLLQIVKLYCSTNEYLVLSPELIASITVQTSASKKKCKFFFTFEQMSSTELKLSDPTDGRTKLLCEKGTKLGIYKLTPLLFQLNRIFVILEYEQD